MGTTTFVLPDWIPKDLWESYLEMRKKIRKPATEHAKELIVKKLVRLRRQMVNDPIAVLEQSIMQCNQGVWPIAIPFANRNGVHDAPKKTPQNSHAQRRECQSQ